MRLYQVCLAFIILLFGNKNYSQNFENPPGTIQLNENLYIDVTPTNNLMFLEYLQNSELLSTKKLDSILDNSPSYGLNKNSFFNKNNKSEKIKILNYSQSEKYLYHPKYAHYPSINILKEQAIDYCEWRTRAVLLNFAFLSKSENDRNKYPKNLKYRLPTKEEFNLAVETFGYSKGYKPEEKDIPYKIYSKKYKSTYKKAIFIENNLSEYTLDSLPVGRNWKNKKPTNQANNYTSFRCVCEILD